MREWFRVSTFDFRYSQNTQPTLVENGIVSGSISYTTTSFLLGENYASKYLDTIVFVPSGLLKMTWLNVLGVEIQIHMYFVSDDQKGMITAKCVLRLSQSVRTSCRSTLDILLYNVQTYVIQTFNIRSIGT